MAALHDAMQRTYQALQQALTDLKYQFKVRDYLVLYLLAPDLVLMEVFRVCLGPMKD